MKLHQSILAALALAPLSLHAQAPAEQPPAAAASVGKITITVEKDGKTETRTVDLSPDAIGKLIGEASAALQQATADPTKEKVTYLGVMLADSTGDAASSLPILKGSGLLVGGIAPQSPAEKAGFKTGDILAKLDDQVLVTPPQLTVLVRAKKDGESVKVTFFRDGQPHEATVALASRVADDAPPAPAVPTQPGLGALGALLGGGGNGGPTPDWSALLGQLGGGQALDILKGRVIRLTPDGRIEIEEAKPDGPKPMLEFNRDAAKEKMEKYRQQWEEGLAKAGEMKERAAEGIKKQLAELREQMERSKQEAARSQAETAEKLSLQAEKAKLDAVRAMEETKLKLSEQVEKARAEAIRAQEQLKRAVEEMRKQSTPPVPHDADHSDHGDKPAEPKKS